MRTRSGKGSVAISGFLAVFLSISTVVGGTRLDERVCMPRFLTAHTFLFTWHGSSVVRDLNGDGRGDFVLFSRDVRIYFGEAGQSFREVRVPNVSEVKVGEAGDFNGDGACDVVISLGPDRVASCDQPEPALRVYLSVAGGPPGPEPFEIELPGSAVTLAAHDVTGDGATDLFAVGVCLSAERERRKRLFYLEGNPEGPSPFKDLVELPSRTAQRNPAYLTFRFGDCTGDGLCDVVLWDAYTAFEVYVAHADPTFGFNDPVIRERSPGEKFWHHCGLADTNGDGVLDICVWRSAGEERWYQDSLVVPSLFSPRLEGRSYRGGPQAHFPASSDPVPLLSSRGTLFADFDGDGVKDCVNRLRSAVVFSKGERDPHTGRAEFAREGPCFWMGRSPYELIACDFDGDGFLDCAAPSIGDDEYFNAGFQVAFNRSADPEPGPIFSAATVLLTYSSPVGLIARDFNEDGLLDIAYAGFEGSVSVPGLGEVPIPYGYGVFFQQRGPQGITFRGPELHEFSWYPYYLTPGDFCEGQPSTPLNPGELCDVHEDTAIFETADVNGDGLSDLLYCMNNSTCPTCSRYTGVFAHLGRAPHVRPRVVSPTEPAQWWRDWGIQVADGTKGIAAADFNQDGIVDMAVGGFHGQAITVLLGEPSCHDTQVFVRAEVNGDLVVDISDAVALANFLFGNYQVSCPEAADVNADGRKNLSDVMALLSYLFQGGDPPRPPFRFYGPCP